MAKINTTDITDPNKRTIDWYNDGEGAGAANLNRPMKEIATAINETGVMNDFPRSKPVVMFDLANSKTLPADMQISRSCDATYVDNDGVIKTASPNIPRFDHDPETGECLGLLIEGYATNYVTDTVSIGDWTQTNSTVGSASFDSPDDSTCFVMIPNAVDSSDHSSTTPLTNSTASNARCISLWAKPSGYNFVDVNGFLFDVENGTLETTPGGSDDAGIIGYRNGWYRVWIKNSGNTSLTVKVFNDINRTNFIGDTTGGVAIWGVQAEAADKPTSYIPGSVGIRTVETVQMDCPWFNQKEGSTFIKYHSGGYIEQFDIAKFYNSVGTDHHTFRHSENNFVSYTGPGQQQLYLYTSPHVVTAVSGSFGVDDSKLSASVPFSMSGRLESPTVAQSGIDKLRFGDDYSTGFHLAKFAYYNKQLPIHELDALTRDGTE